MEDTRKSKVLYQGWCRWHNPAVERTDEILEFCVEYKNSRQETTVVMPSSYF